MSEGESGRVTVRCEWSLGGNGFRAKLRVHECGPTANATCTLVGARCLGRYQAVGCRTNNNDNVVFCMNGKWQVFCISSAL